MWQKYSFRCYQSVTKYSINQMCYYVTHTVARKSTGSYLFIPDSANNYQTDESCLSITKISLQT